MKRKFLTTLVVLAGLVLGACQEDATMDELIQDTELNSSMDPEPSEGDDNPPPPPPPSGN